MTNYSVDSSALINAWHYSYPPDVFGSLWYEKFPELASQGRLMVVDAAYREVQAGGDDLAKWLAKHKNSMRVLHTEDIQASQRALVNNPKYKRWVTHTTQDTADPWVIALALVKGALVINDEKGYGSIQPGKDLKIPDVCREQGLKLASWPALFRAESWAWPAGNPQA